MPLVKARLGNVLRCLFHPDFLIQEGKSAMCITV